MATSEEIEKLRDALRRFSAGSSGVSYLGEEGVRELIRLVTNRIEASGGGGSSWVPEPGAYVAYTDADGVNRIAKPSEYKSEGNTPCGVLVVHGGGSLLVSLTGEYEESGDDVFGDAADYVRSESSMERALNDLCGKETTLLAYTIGKNPDAGNIGAVARTCWTWTQSGNVSPWWLPSLGELRIIHDNIDAVEEALAAAGGESLLEYNLTHASSTQYRTGRIWVWNFVKNEVSDTDSELWNNVIRPVSRFAWVPDGYSGGGEPDYVEPETHTITAEPSRLDFDGSDFSDTERTVVVTSPTEWNEVGNYDKVTIHVSPGSGPAGVTEVAVTIGTDESIYGTLVFEDGDGNTAEVYLDNHYGE